ncbi:hypothetical protein JCM10212_005063 [Sporobolomyces blumeae]
MADYDAPPPSKASLLKWWKAFTSKDKKAASSASAGAANAAAGQAQGQRAPSGLPAYSPPGRGLERGKDGKGRVFGVSLEQSLQYASVAISMVGQDGKQYVYGYVPIIVAKCGMMLKETATRTEGIFRVSGSNKRINQLQAVFDEPPRYGKDFDWTGFSVHDAASVLRRYLNSLPEPVIPAGLYLDFTAVLQRPQPIEDSIAAYRHLISLLPPASRYLLLYLLDFLSVFARCSSKNLMTASNLAVVFQPGLVSSRRDGTNTALLGFPGFVEGKLPRTGSVSGQGQGQGGAQEQAGEHGKGKEVLEFLIEQQSHFMIGLEPPVDAERQKNKGVGPTPPTTMAAGAATTSNLAASTSGAAPPLSGTGVVDREAERAKGADLVRRGSDKSIERRRLRKSTDAGKEGGKVKRSKTWGSSSGKRKARNERGESPSASPHPPSTAAFASPSAPRPPPSAVPPKTLTPPSTAAGAARASFDSGHRVRDTSPLVPSAAATKPVALGGVKKPRKSETSVDQQQPVPPLPTTTTAPVLPAKDSAAMVKTGSAGSAVVEGPRWTRAKKSPAPSDPTKR